MPHKTNYNLRDLIEYFMQTKLAESNLVEVVCQGPPNEMGLAQGSSVRNKIHAARQVLTNLETFRLQQPWWVPYRAYRWLADCKASRFLAQCNNPEMNQRLAGIAEGAGVSLKAICLFNALEPLLSAVGGYTELPGACSAVAVRGRRSATGEPIVARNFDYLPLIQPFYIVRESRSQGKFRALELTEESRMLELVLIVMLLICGAAVGWLTGSASGISTVAALLAMIGGFAGTAFAYIILTVIKRDRSSQASIAKRPRAMERIAIGTQTAFGSRMANYLKISEADIQEPDSYKSSMSFWSIVEVYGSRTCRTA